jgi:hypothetical protein
MERCEECEVSELMQQHEGWKARNERLWRAGEAQPKRNVRDTLAALVPVYKAPAEPEWGCPINCYALPSPKIIIKLVALKHGVPVATMIGPLKSNAMVAARDEAIGLVYTHCRVVSLGELGRLFNRDHTSILHALRKMRLAGKNYYRRKNGHGTFALIPTIHESAQVVNETLKH